MQSVHAAHLAIGRAVCAAQTFEVMFAVCAEFFLMVTDDHHHKKTGGRFKHSRLKNPTKNVVGQLADRGCIDDSLKDKIEDVLEKRHLLVHRWFAERGFSSSQDNEGWLAYRDLAIEVELRTNKLSKLLVGYVVRWAEPNWASQNKEEFLERMRALFMQSLGELDAK
jgi:hypothetical protein